MKLSFILIMLFAACISGCERPQTKGAAEGSPPNIARLSKAFVRVDKHSLAIDGSIDALILAEFKSLWDSYPDTKQIPLRSGGGEVMATMEIGREIRQWGLDIVVDGRCYSSCAN